MRRERSFPGRSAMIYWHCGFFWRFKASGDIENQSPAVAKGDFFGLPGGALVEAFGVGIGWIPGAVEPVEIQFVIGNPFLDRLPGLLDGLHGLDIEGGWWRAWEMDDACPEAVEAEEELDFLAPDDGADPFHGPLAARTLERVAAPDLEDEVAPEGAHVAGPAFGRGGDEEDLGGRWFLGWRLG